MFRNRAGVAELADAQDLGSCGVTPVEVQLLSPAPVATPVLSPIEQVLPPRRARVRAALKLSLHRPIVTPVDWLLHHMN